MYEAYNIDYSLFGEKPEGRAQLMKVAYNRAAAVDRSDPYAVYDAAYDLARAYDKTMRALKKGPTTFIARPSKRKVKVSALEKRNQTVKIRVTILSKGSLKPTFAIKKVTKGQRSKVKVNKKTGRVTIKKKTKKCVIYVNVISKESKYRKARTKTVRIKVR